MGLESLHSDRRTWRSKQSLFAMFRTGLKSELKFFKRAEFFSCADVSEARRRLAEEYCCTITQAVGRPYRGRSGSSVLKFAFNVFPTLQTYIVQHMRKSRLLPDLPQRNYFISCGVCTFYADEEDRSICKQLNYLSKRPSDKNPEDSEPWVLDCLTLTTKALRTN